MYKFSTMALVVVVLLGCSNKQVFTGDFVEYRAKNVVNSKVKKLDIRSTFYNRGIEINIKKGKNDAVILDVGKSYVVKDDGKKVDIIVDDIRKKMESKIDIRKDTVLFIIPKSNFVRREEGAFENVGIYPDRKKYNESIDFSNYNGRRISLKLCFLVNNTEQFYDITFIINDVIMN